MSGGGDWRLTGQERALRGAPVAWRAYRAPRPGWDHDHCVFCWAKFMEDDADALSEGWNTTDERDIWICPTCFDDLAELCDWRVEGVR